jgi:hypothetical protein
MFGFNYYELFKYHKLDYIKLNKNNPKASYLFVYRKNLDILQNLNLNYDKNLNRLVYYLKYKKIDFVFIFFNKSTIIHSSGVSLKKNCCDKFFFYFQKSTYGVIGPTFTNNLYRGKSFYKFALQLQINHLVRKHKINDIYISTKKLKKTSVAFEFNNLKKFTQGMIISIFNKFFIYVIFKKPLSIKIFLNDKIILNFGKT